MARIAGIDLPNSKRVEYGLTYIFGIGVSTSNKILAATGIDPNTRCKDLTEEQVGLIRDYIDHHLTVEGDLRRTQERARVRPRQLPTRRNKLGGN